MIPISSSRSAWLAVLVGFVAACGQQPAPAPQPKPVAKPEGSEAWTQFSNEFIENYFVAQPFFAVSAGRHEFDGKMPDCSATGIKKTIEWLKRARAQAEAHGRRDDVSDAAHRTRAFDERHRRRAFLDGSRAVPLQQSRLVHRQPRSERLCQPRVRFAREAAGRLHRLRAIDTRHRRGDSPQPAHPAAEELHRAWHRRLRRIRRVLSQGCAEDLCGRQERGPAAQAGGSQRSGRQGDGRVEDLARGRAQEWH